MSGYGPSALLTRARSSFGSFRGAATDAAEDAADSAKDSVEDAVDDAKDMVEDAKEAGGKAAKKAKAAAEKAAAVAKAAVEKAAAEAKLAALQHARGAAMLVVEKAKEPVDQAQAALTDVIKQLQQAAAALEDTLRTISEIMTSTAAIISSQASSLVESLEDKIANPTALLPKGQARELCVAVRKEIKEIGDQPSPMSFLFDTEQIAAGLRTLVDAARAAAQSFIDAAAAIVESIRGMAARLTDFPAALKDVSAQLAGLGSVWLSLRNDDAITPKDLAVTLNSTAAKLGAISAGLTGFDLPVLDSAPLKLALQEFAKFVTGAPLTIREIVAPKKFFGVSTKPLIKVLSTDAAALDALIADVEAKGQSVAAGVGPITAALDSMGSQKLDTATLSQPCDDLVVRLKATATTLSDMPWPL